MSENTNPLNDPWESVEIVLTYSDRGNLKIRDVHLTRAEIEASERDKAREQARNRFSDDEDEGTLSEHLRAIDEWTLSPDEFQERVVSNVENMVVAPLRVRGVIPNSFRILPPWAVVEVKVTVNGGQDSGLVLPIN